MSDANDPLLQEAEQQRLKQQLLWRLGVAVAAMVVIVTGIYLLDRPAKPERKPAPARIAPAPTPAPSVAASAASEATSAPAEVAASEVQPTPTTPPTPVAPPTQTPSPTQTTPEPEGELEISSPITTSKPVPRLTAAQPRAIVTPALVKPVAPVMPTGTSIAKPAAPITPVASGQYTVQAGVFRYAGNAEQLTARLKAAGLPAYLETRVQIGPFKTRAEADAAAAKLRELGIQPVLAPQR
ncbi:SPOR domain-containing protein [Chitinibacteraceae bacterium HSL-7]